MAIQIKDIYIGEVIMGRLKEMHLKPADLAKRLKYSLPGTTRMLKSKSMNTDVLQNVYAALEYDFFRHYADCPAGNEELQKINEEIKEKNEILKGRNEAIGKEVEYLKKIVGLYENQRSEKSDHK